MGNTTTSTNTTSQATPTAEETALNKLQLGQAQANDPTQRQLNQNAGSLINQLLTGDNKLPGFLGNLGEGISQDQMNSTIDYSLRDMNAQLAKSGAGTFMESGASQAVGARTAADLRNANQQYNQQNKFNLLNLATGNAAQIQQPMLNTANMLGQRLAGLRTNTGTSAVTSNPFLNSFYSAAGNSLGGGNIKFNFGA